MSARVYIHEYTGCHRDIAVVFESVLIRYTWGIRCVSGGGCPDAFKPVSMAVDNAVGSRKKPVH